MFHYFYWFSRLCNYKWCVTSYINLVAKFLNFLKDFTPTLYKLIFFLLASAICHYVTACRKTEKILGKIKGPHWQRPITGKESRRSKLKRQENLDSIREKDREQQKRYWERKKAGKTTITSPIYKTTITLTRAIRKAELLLPNSPGKHSQVVQKLFVAWVEVQQRLWAGHH